MSEKKKNILAAALLGLMVLAFLNYWFNQRPGQNKTPTPQAQPAPVEPSKLAQDKGALLAKPFNANEQQVKDLLRKPAGGGGTPRGNKPGAAELPEERPAVDWDAVVAKVELDWGDDPFAIPVDENAGNGQGGSLALPGMSGSRGGRVEGPLAKLSLEGILRVHGQDSAIINDRVLQAGDEIDGFQVVSVSSRGVVLFKDGESHLLQLPASSDEDAGGGIEIRGKKTKAPERPVKQDEDEEKDGEDEDGGDKDEDSGVPKQGLRPEKSESGAVFLPPQAGYKTPSRR